MADDGQKDSVLASYWDGVYRDRGSKGVSWYQAKPMLSLELVRRLEIPRNAAIIDIGGGSAPLVDCLLALGYEDVSMLDASGVALAETRDRVGDDPRVKFLHVALGSWRPERRYALWHDRAVFHFQVDRDDRKSYLARLRCTVDPGGAVIIATFAEDGPAVCSGLPVARYSPAELADVLGPGFELVDTRRELHVTPAGETQPFTWIAARS